MTQGLVVDDVTVRFGEQVAVDAVDLDLAVGQVLSVLGPSGCGKSTLLRVIEREPGAVQRALEGDGRPR